MPPATPAGSPIKVLHVVQNLEPGGTERRMLTLLRELDRTRFEPSICCIDGYGPLREEAADLGVELFLLGRSGRLDLPSLGRLVRLLRNRRTAIVHSWLFYPNVFGRLAGRAARVPVVIAAEGGETLMATSRRRRLMLTTVNRLLAPLTDTVVANSRAVADSVRAAGIPADKIETIPNGVEIPAPVGHERRVELRRLLPVRPDARIVGMVSRFDPTKDHGTFLTAASLVLGERSDVQFVLVGGGPTESSVIAEARALGLGESALFAGSRADARELIAGFDVVVQCSFSEGFPNSVLEAMASERPVVATDLPSIREAIVPGEHGLTVPPGDAGALAAAIVSLLDDPSLAERLGRSARERVVNCFSAGLQAERTMELYSRLLQARRAAPDRGSRDTRG